MHEAAWRHFAIIRKTVLYYGIWMQILPDRNSLQIANPSLNKWPEKRQRMNLARQIKSEALNLGFKKVAINTADDFTEYIEVLAARFSP